MTPAERRWPWLAAAAAIVLLGVLLRLYHLGFQEVWLDETLQLRMATTERLAEALRLEYSPPLGYLLWRGWVSVFGESEVALRALAAIFGILFVPVVIAAGRTLFSPAAGLWAGLFAALAPLHVYYSQEARSYSLLCLALALCHWTLWRAVLRPRPAAWAAFSASACLALFTHHFAALALAPAILVAWRQRGFYFSAAAAGIPWATWVGWSWLVNTQIVRGYQWVTALWNAIPPALALPKSFEALVFGPQHGSIPGYFKQFTVLDFPPALRWGGVAILAALCAVSLSPWNDGEDARRRKAWLAAVVVFPLAALWTASWWVPTYVVARYDLVAFPGLVLLVAQGLAKLRGLARGLAAPLAAALFFGVIGAKLSLYYTLPVFAAGTAPSRDSAAALDAFVAEGDLVVLSAYRGATVGYYLRRLGYRESDGRFESPSGRSFALRRLPTHPSSLFFNVDHPERPRFDLEETRLDLRGYLARLDPSRATVWVEVLPELPRLPQFRNMLAEELARAGWREAPLPPGLGPGHVTPYRAR